MKNSVWEKLYLIGLTSGLVLVFVVVGIISVLTTLYNNSKNQTVIEPTEMVSKEKSVPYVIPSSPMEKKSEEKPMVVQSKVKESVATPKVETVTKPDTVSVVPDTTK